MTFTKGKKLFLLGFILVLVDQIIKVFIKTEMSIGESIHVFGDWFQILFVENEGMAFGMKFGGDIGKYILTFFRVILFGAIWFWVFKLIKKKGTPTGVVVGLTLIAAGALGNIIDCICYGQIFSESTYTQVAEFGGKYAPIMLGKVVDMFYLPIIDTVLPQWLPWVGGEPFLFFSPVFNFADSCVSVGAMYLIFFHYKFFSSEKIE